MKFLQSGEQSTIPICLESLGTSSILFWQHRFATRRPDLEIIGIKERNKKFVYHTRIACIDEEELSYNVTTKRPRDSIKE